MQFNSSTLHLVCALHLIAHICSLYYKSKMEYQAEFSVPFGTRGFVVEVKWLHLTLSSLQFMVIFSSTLLDTSYQAPLEMWCPWKCKNGGHNMYRTVSLAKISYCTRPFIIFVYIKYIDSFLYIYIINFDLKGESLRYGNQNSMPFMYKDIDVSVYILDMIYIPNLCLYR